MKKTEIINNRLATIIKYSGNDGTRNYEIVARVWEKYGKSRTYFKVIETRENSTMHTEYDFGYVDNNTDEYVAGKKDAEKNYTLSGASFEEEIEEVSEETAEIEEVSEETAAITNETKKTENKGEKEMNKYTVEMLFENGEWDNPIGDYVEATSEEEAIEFAKDWMKDRLVEQGEDPDVVDSYEFRVK